MPLFGDEGHAHCTHKAWIGGTDDLAACVLFHSPHNGVIFKGTSLDHNALSQRVQVGDTDHLCKYILYDGAAQSRHDVLRQAAVSLLGDDAAVHKDRTAASQLCRVL